MLNAHDVAVLRYGPIPDGLDPTETRLLAGQRACLARRWLARRGLEPAGFGDVPGTIRAESLWDEAAVYAELARSVRSEAARRWRANQRRATPRPAPTAKETP